MFQISISLSLIQTISMKKPKPTNQTFNLMDSIFRISYPHILFFSLAYILIIDTYEMPIYYFAENYTKPEFWGMLPIQVCYYIFTINLFVYLISATRKHKSRHSLINLNKHYTRFFIAADAFLILCYYHITPNILYS